MNAHFRPNIVWYPERPQPRRNTVVIWSPEVVCHDDKTYGSWNVPVTDVHIDQADSESECKVVNMSCSHPGIYRVNTICKYIDPNSLEFQLVLTNLSEQLWQNAYAEACIQLATAPDFRYADGVAVSMRAPTESVTLPKNLCLSMNGDVSFSKTLRSHSSIH